MDKRVILGRLDRLSMEYIKREEELEKSVESEFNLGFKQGVIDCRSRLENLRKWVDWYGKLPGITEECPSCGEEVALLWDTERDGYKAFCPYCGERLMLCSACHDDDFACDYDSETDGCRWNPAKEGRKKNDSLCKRAERSTLELGCG